MDSSDKRSTATCGSLSCTQTIDDKGHCYLRWFQIHLRHLHIPLGGVSESSDSFRAGNPKGNRALGLMPSFSDTLCCINAFDDRNTTKETILVRQLWWISSQTVSLNHMYKKKKKTLHPMKFPVIQWPTFLSLKRSSEMHFWKQNKKNLRWVESSEVTWSAFRIPEWTKSVSLASLVKFKHLHRDYRNLK